MRSADCQLPTADHQLPIAQDDPFIRYLSVVPIAADARSKAMRLHKQASRWGLFALMCLIVLVIDMPIISLILNSFRSTAEIRWHAPFW